jgi:hypothetical protein
MGKSFRTAPTFSRKRGNWRSIQNAKAFMFQLFRKNLKKCSYDTLVFEFVSFFGSNESRTVERYLGRPERIERDAGKTKVIRMNRTSGRIAQFDYYNERRLPAKKGLLDILGWILKLKDGTVLINHEVMSYYTRQVKLEPAIPLQEDESSEASKDKMCVSSLREEKHNQGILQGKELEKTVLEVVSTPNLEATERIVTERKEEEDIDSTHTCKYGADYASKHIEYALTPSEQLNHKVNPHLTPEEEAILNAKPVASKPDRAKVTWTSRKESSPHV